jgi:GT2 family glycosyltransferase
VLLAESLDALANQTSPPALVIVVDNASSAATQQVLAATAGIQVVRSEVNLGGAGGFALGMQQALRAGARWIWLMDDDAIPDAAALGILEQRIHERPGHFDVLCSCVMEFGAIANMHRRYFSPVLGIERVLGSGAYACDACPVDTASFVGFMVSAAAVRAVGLPNPAFFLSYDDTEYSLRLRRSGFHIWLVPASVIVHKRSAQNRLRHTPFGPKHYFNIRNRIIVKRQYSRAGLAGALSGALFGLALWIRSPGRLQAQPRRTFRRALADGFSGRLGPIPQDLERTRPHG